MRYANAREGNVASVETCSGEVDEEQGPSNEAMAPVIYTDGVPLLEHLPSRA